MDLIFLAIILEVIKGKVSDLADEGSVLTLCSHPSFCLICLMGKDCTSWLQCSFYPLYFSGPVAKRSFRKPLKTWPKLLKKKYFCVLCKIASIWQI